jgi:hypothetical protein
MKKLPAFLLACALLGPAAAFAASFEGKLHLKISSGNDSVQEMDYGIKQGLVRIDVQTKQAGRPAMILNSARQEVTILLPEQKMYMVQPITQHDQAAAGAAEQVKLEKTGIKEKILGYDCEKYVAIAKDGTSEMWLTGQLGSFLGFGPGPEGAGMMGGGRSKPASGPQSWEAALAGKDSFPLRVTTTNAKGKVTARLEVTSIEPRALPDSDFAPPAGWQKLDMGAMMRGLLPGGR